MEDTLQGSDSVKGRPGPKYQMMQRLHLRESGPYLVGRFFLDYALFEHGPPAQFRRLPTLPILHSIAGDRIAKAWQTLTVGTADLEIAELLKLALNAPIVKVDRFALDRDGVILYVGHGIYRGDSVVMEIELR